MTDSLSFSQSLREWMSTFIHRSMRDSARFVKARGFSMPQFFLLMQVHRYDQCGISDLSDHLEITTAAVSQLVDKLVQTGLLARTEDPNDRRAKQISLTPAGEEIVEKAVAERSRWVDELAESLSVEEKEKITEALKIMTQAVKKMEMETEK